MTDFLGFASSQDGREIAMAEGGRFLGAGQVNMKWTPNKVTLLRVAVGFAAVSLFGRGAWASFAAVALTVAAIALDAMDGHIAWRKNLATPMGAQLDILGDRMIENVYFTYFAVVGFWEKRGEEESTQSTQRTQRLQRKSGKREVAGSESGA
jgi:hypothetical protein